MRFVVFEGFLDSKKLSNFSQLSSVSGLLDLLNFFDFEGFGDFEGLMDSGVFGEALGFEFCSDGNESIKPSQSSS